MLSNLGVLILFSLFLVYYSLKFFPKAVTKNHPDTSLNDTFHTSKCHSEYIFKDCLIFYIFDFIMI